MAASDWLFDETIAGLKRRANIPSSAEGWATADFRAYANDSMRGYILPMLRRLSEEFFVTNFDTTVTSGTSRYRASYRALGEALRDVQYTNAAGGYRSLVRREPHQLSSDTSTGSPEFFSILDDSVVLSPTPGNSSDVLRLRCLVRPNKLVATSRVYKVVSKGATTLVTTCLDTTVTDDAATFFGSSATVDVIKAQPGFRHLLIDAAATVATTTLTIAAGGLTDVAVGDYVCVAEESPVAQLPAELHPLLAQDIACAVLRASSGSGLAEATAERDRLEAIALGLFSPRTENQPRYIVNNFGAGVTLRRRIG